MNRLEEVLISFRDITENTGETEVCNISSFDILSGTSMCPFTRVEEQDCHDCILDRRTKLDKEINILNKLGE